MKWLQSRPFGEALPEGPARRSIDELRERTLEAMADCSRPHDDRIRMRVGRAATVQQLWLARSEIYDSVARQHCEAEAVRRINELVPAFEGWLPPGALRRL